MASVRDEVGVYEYRPGITPAATVRDGGIICRFHGWVYNAQGELVNVPQEERFYSCFDKAGTGA